MIMDIIDVRRNVEWSYASFIPDVIGIINLLHFQLILDVIDIILYVISILLDISFGQFRSPTSSLMLLWMGFFHIISHWVILDVIVAPFCLWYQCHCTILSEDVYKGISRRRSKPSLWYRIDRNREAVSTRARCNNSRAQSQECACEHVIARRCYGCCVSFSREVWLTIWFISFLCSLYSNEGKIRAKRGSNFLFLLFCFPFRFSKHGEILFNHRTTDAKISFEA